NGPSGARRKIATSICKSVTTRPAERAFAVADMRIMGRVGGRAEETGTSGGMQGSSSPALPLLYSTAVTVRFFDAAALALFAPEPGLVLSAAPRSEHRYRDLC